MGAALDGVRRSGYKVSAAVSTYGGAWSTPFLPAVGMQVSHDGRLLNVGGWLVGLWPVA